RLLLTPFIKTGVIARAVADLNENWRSEILPEVEETLGAVSKSLLSGRLDADQNLAARSKDLRVEIGTIRSNVSTLAFVAPQEDTWWQSSRGKDATAEAIATTAIDRIKAKRLSRDVESLQKSAKEITAELDQAVKDSEAAMERLEAQFEEQKKKAEEL